VHPRHLTYGVACELAAVRPESLLPG
jgi:hypothetical protein